jgi:signal transduction histidine kinase
VELAIDFQPDLDDRAVVPVSKMHLQHVLTILIENSVRAMFEPGSEQKRILVSTRLANQKVEISISDTGNGIPLEMQPNIFVTPLTTEQGRHGAGMGCTVACCLLDLFEGKIALKTSGTDGTIVVISLPVQYR